MWSHLTTKQCMGPSKISSGQVNTKLIYDCVKRSLGTFHYAVVGCVWSPECLKVTSIWHPLNLFLFQATSFANLHIKAEAFEMGDYSLVRFILSSVV